MLRTGIRDWSQRGFEPPSREAGADSTGGDTRLEHPPILRGAGWWVISRFKECLIHQMRNAR